MSRMRTFTETERAVDVARAAAAAGGAAALAWWRKTPPVEAKPDRSPVTQADRDANDAILGVLREAFPRSRRAVRGERDARARGLRLPVDRGSPLDGTRDFLRGDATWGPLVALEHQGRLVAAGHVDARHGRDVVGAEGRPGCFAGASGYASRP